MNSSIPLLSVKGKPFEMGEQYGKQARGLIKKNLEIYFKYWSALLEMDRATVLKTCSVLKEIIGEYDDRTLQELEGIAEGADRSLDEIIALNSRYELAAAGQDIKVPIDGCTSISAMPSVTKDGHCLIGQNWDYLERVKGINVILERYPDGEPGIVSHTEAGILIHRSMNSARIGLCINAMATNRDTFGKTTPLFVVARNIQRADSYYGAIKEVMRAEVSVSFNFLIAHKDGETMDLEVSPFDVGFIHPKNGILTHSNHFLTQLGRFDMIDQMKSTSPDTLYRAERARRLIEEDAGEIDQSSYQRVFSDHFGYPNAICRHVDEQEPETMHFMTLSSAIMDLTERSFSYTEGSPCAHDYTTIRPKCLRK